MQYYVNGMPVSVKQEEAVLRNALEADGGYCADDVWAWWKRAPRDEEARENLIEYGIELVV